MSREKAEKASEQAKKATKKLMQMRGDQRKAQKNDDVLFRILKEFIGESRYEVLLDPVIGVLSINTPSHFIIGIISLVYPPAEVYILESERSPQGDIPRSAFERNPYSNTIPSEFNDSTLDPAIRKRIMDWIDDMAFLVTHNPSLILTRALLRLLARSSERRVVEDCLREVFLFFLRDVSLTLSAEDANSYAQFIVARIEKKADTLLQKHLHTQSEENDFLTDTIDEKDAQDALFGKL